MSRRHFGTDGVRGVANKTLTPELAMALGQAAGRWLVAAGHAPKAVLGRDTRQSGAMLGAAVSAGLCSAGVDVVDLGVATTGCVSYLSRTADFSLGVVISASHNPAPDNGVKFVGHDGRKLTDETEVEIEALMSGDFDRPTGARIGVLSVDSSPIDHYEEFLMGLLPAGLHGRKVVVDGSNGAAYEVGPKVLKRLGADLIETGVSPDGVNINAEGGATKPETVCKLTEAIGAWIGVAFDGDADRVIFSDGQGRLINGDRTIGLWAVQEQAQGRLNPPSVVGTVMTNGAFAEYLRPLGIELKRAAVGDKNVAKLLEDSGARVGGEQSGHVIFPELGPTGDGLVTMLQFMKVLLAGGVSPAEAVDAYEPRPQLLVNLGLDSMQGWSDAIGPALADAELQYGSDIRVVVRPSGTQPVVRVMVEAVSYPIRDLVADRLVAALLGTCGGSVHGKVDLTHALGD